jgi:outer membrane protein assembly factor BamB
VAGDTVYVISGSPQQVYMLDAETGAQKGTFMPQGEHKGVVYWSPVTVADVPSGSDLAFVGFADSQSRVAGLYAFDPETGQEMWNVQANNTILPAPSYADGAVYYGDSDGMVYAVDVETQRIKPGWPFEAQSAIWASPLISEGRVYVAAMDHHVYCLDAETGEEIWNVQVGGAMAAAPSLNTSNGILYVGAYDGKEYAIQADSGQILEGFDFQAENWIWSEPLLFDDRLFVTALDGKLYALDPASGAIIPPYPYDSGEIDDKENNAVLRAAPVPAGDYIVVANQTGQVIAVREAQRQWYWPSGVPQAQVLTTPVVRDDVIYVALMDGQVQTLDAESGVPGWSFAPPTED